MYSLLWDICLRVELLGQMVNLEMVSDQENLTISISAPKVWMEI